MINVLRILLVAATYSLLTPTASLARDMDPLILHMTNVAVAGRVEPEEYNLWVAQIDRIIRQYGIAGYDIRALREMAERLGETGPVYRPGLMKIIATLLVVDNSGHAARRIPDDVRRLVRNAVLRSLDAEDAASRRGALVILRQLPGDDIAAPVIAMLKDGDDPVRLEALMILRDLSQGAKRAAIAAAAASVATDPNPSVREAAVAIIERARD